MRQLWSSTLALSLVLMWGVASAADVRVSAVVETPDALFFQPSSFPDVVWYFPRTAIRTFPAVPAIPGQNYWRAAVELRAVDVSDPATLRSDWAGKALVPFIVRPPKECNLLRQPEMRFVIQEYRELNRDVSAANAAPVCQYSFRLPAVIPSELTSRLAELVANGTLIEHHLPIALLVEARVGWHVVHSAVAAELGRHGVDELTPGEARAAVGSALAGPALVDLGTAMTADESQAFLDSAVAALFSPGRTWGKVLFSSVPPKGEIVYHLEPFARSM
jgi:hypothetical protein